jgi:hypothetical protein
MKPTLKLAWLCSGQASSWNSWSYLFNFVCVSYADNLFPLAWHQRLMRVRPTGPLQAEALVFILCRAWGKTNSIDSIARVQASVRSQQPPPPPPSQAGPVGFVARDLTGIEE